MYMNQYRQYWLRQIDPELYQDYIDLKAEYSKEFQKKGEVSHWMQERYATMKSKISEVLNFNWVTEEVSNAI